MSCRPLALGSTDQLGPGSEARNATVLGLNDVDKQKLEEARQLAMSMTSHPVAFGTIEHTEKAGELLAELVHALDQKHAEYEDLKECAANNARNLAREAHTWSKAAETYAAELERHKPLLQAVEWLLDDGHMNTEHLARLRATWEAALGPNVAVERAR
jgi:hypothetical protein